MFNRLFNHSWLELSSFFFSGMSAHLHTKIKPGPRQNGIGAHAHQTAPIQRRPFSPAKIAIIGVFVSSPAHQKGLCSPRIWLRFLF